MYSVHNRLLDVYCSVYICKSQHTQFYIFRSKIHDSKLLHCRNKYVSNNKIYRQKINNYAQNPVQEVNFVKNK